jgi:nucleoside-diphosphate-sugar epimerase
LGHNPFGIAKLRAPGLHAALALPAAPGYPAAMRVLIVGCGYVGLPLGAELARQGHEVSGLRRTEAAAARLVAAGIRPLAGDVSRPETLAALPAEYDWVVNCVASGGGDAATYRETYLHGTANVLAWLAPRPPQKFLYTSSTSVYGQTDGSTVKETSPTEPEAETAKILVETEQLLLAAFAGRGFPAVILRVAGIYGPGRGHAFKLFLKNEARLEGDGSRLLNMIHRDDLIGCIIAALQSGRPGEIYNAVDDEPVTQAHFHQWLAATLGKDPPPHEPAGPADLPRRGATHKRVSNRKFKMEIGRPFLYPNFRLGYSAEILRLERAGELEAAPEER